MPILIHQKVAGSIPAGVSGFFIDIKSLRSHYGPGVDSASSRNEYQVYFLGVNTAGALGWQLYHHPVPLSRNLGTLTSWNPVGPSGPVMGLIYLYFTYSYTIILFCFMMLCIYFSARFNHVTLFCFICFRKNMVHFSSSGGSKAHLLLPCMCGKGVTSVTHQQSSF